MELNIVIEKLRKRTDAALRDRNALVQLLSLEKRALVDARKAHENALKAREIIQTNALNVQTLAHKHLAAVVTRCLSTLMDEPYEFRIIFDRKRGRTEARIVYMRDGHELDPMSEAEGGIIDLTTFALRISALLLSKPRVRRFLILDEPLKFLSAGFRVKCAELLETLQKELGVQILMVTHINEFKLGRVIRL